ncbi:hypothetical protein [Williamsia sp. 1135]|uniref:hypothetical protein n=1 Tax=Williamsia sp. 1135 TaxID=1889262 RepID=UPI0019806C91|nr:hypothetical protein [Williamsia sp. 1135]
MKQNTALVNGIDAEINDLLRRTTSLRKLLLQSYSQSLGCFGTGFLALSASQQSLLVALVNNTKSCAALLDTRISQAANNE